ncbi:zinc iron permease [Lichtheimia corymbifera JMRC:FSU:9682]|uniref:Zinc iron permease n=1 Tax=Lichtheimia corymbifera JMRC:FSU:9682 TaxID=1263082 RepID=A0A068RN88_9FUNG|nr:zinc iron permease [Lichtheimia corymbifera JMRC:FSU:9682]
MDTTILRNDENWQESWLLVLISSTACILGASVVFIDTVWPSSRYHSSCASILEQPKVIASSMALASGVMLFSSLFTLLPASRARLASDHLMYLYYFVGIATTIFINRCIHWCAPNAIHAYNEGPHQHHHHPSPLEHPVDSCSSQSTLLPTTATHDDDPSCMKSTTTGNLGEHTRLHWNSIEYGAVTQQQQQQHPDYFDPVKSNDQGNDYFRIGIQTAVAICIHKFPEGLIMFISGQASSRLGLSVCAAMSIHNFIEGFMIALPLYFATKSRGSAFGYAALLGGLSQPIGAVLGLIAFREVSQEQQDTLFGVTFGVVSGMMSFIAVQSMLPQAIKADTQQRYASVFFFVGIFLVGLASTLKSV